MVIADEQWARNEVHAGLTEPEYTLLDHSDPATAGEAVKAQEPHLVVIDLQVASMGGMAIARDLHQRAAMDGEEEIPVVLLLDRKADTFLAKRAGVAGWVVKPFTAGTLEEKINKIFERVAA